MPSLQNLPPELLEVVASYLAQADLAAMAQTCTHINKACIPTLYKVIVLDDEGCEKIADCLVLRIDLAQLVRSISFDHEILYADHCADELLPLLPNLQHLSFFAHVMDFFDRGHEEDYNALGLGLWWPGPDDRIPSCVRKAASRIDTWLPALKTCTLEFFDASPLWNLERKAVLFLHPTLDSLVVHHAYHEGDLLYPPAENSNVPAEYWRSPIFDADLGPGSTSLKTLRLFLCEIDPAALIKILSFPRDLEHLTWTYPDYASHLFRVDPTPIDAVCIALEQQKHSLISLNIHGLNRYYPKLEFDTFKRLKELDIDLDMLRCAWDEDSSVLTDDHEPSFGLDKFFPPSLEKLTVRYQLLRGKRRQDFYKFECLEKCLANQNTILVSLQTLVLVEEKYVDRIYGSLQDVVEEMRKQIARIRERLICNGIDMLQETELLEADPYPPRLRDLMGYHGNKTYRESYERRWGPIPKGQP